MTDLILVSHNSKKDLERFLPSIAKNTKDYKITIVDNGSDKETVKFLKQLTEGDIIKVIFQKNKGYAAACNAGVRATSGDALVFLNCDLTATEDWLNRLEEPLYDEKVALSGARLYAPNGQEYPTQESSWVCGACIAIKRSVLEDIGGWDENFFLFFEETDLCKRAEDKGYKVVRSECKLVHYHPHFPPFNSKLQEYWDQSEEYFKSKHKIKPLILVAIPHYKESGSTFTTSLLDAIEYCHNKKTEYDLHFLVLAQTVIHDARNKAVELAKKIRAEHLLFIDNDMAFPADAIDELYNSMKEKQKEDRVDILTGLFFKREMPYQPTSLSRLVITDKEDEVKFTPLEEWPEGHVKIDGTGMAFTLIDMRIFDLEKLKQPYFSFAEGVGEDLYFCYFVTTAGAKLYCDTRIKIGHTGRMPVGEATYKNFKEYRNNLKIKELEKANLKNIKK